MVIPKIEEDNFQQSHKKMLSFYHQKIDKKHLFYEHLDLIETKHFVNLFIPKTKTLVKVSKCLIGISNNFYSNNILKSQNDNTLRRSQIYKLLKMKSHNEKVS